MSEAAPAPAGPALELSTRADEPPLRRLLRENPMPGAIRVSLEREPDAFLASAAEGHPHSTVVARDCSSGRIVGMGSRAVMDVFVNGMPARVGYLSQLRLEPAFRRHRRLLARGYALLVGQRRADEEPYDLTSILADNDPALRLLAGGVPGLPTYRPLERLVTLVIPTGATSRPRRRGRLHAEPGSPERLEAIAACLDRNGRRRQFARRWSAPDLVSAERCPGLRPEDFRLALANGEVVGCAAVWDQGAFKQVVVRGYAPRLARWRPWINLVSWLMRAPRLPDPGEALPHAYLSHVAVDEDDPRVFDLLLHEIVSEAARRDLRYLVAGFAARDPLLAVARRRRRARQSESLLHLVHWDEAASAVARLDGRVPHVEVALL